jgi:hypothetical protein
MARTNGLDVARLRQLARVGAEVTLNRLRAEILGGHPKPAIDGHLKTGHHTT